MLLLLDMCLLYVLLVQCYEDEDFISILQSTKIKLGNGLFSSDARNFTVESLFSTNRRKARDADCDCGEGTKGCMKDLNEKVCHCDNNMFVINGLCKDCKCVNGVCNFTKKTCVCLKGYGGGGDVCKKCECGTSDRCEFANNIQLCHCDQYYSINSKCEDCVCPENELCGFVPTKKVCDCKIGANNTDERCKGCEGLPDCERRIDCTYIGKKKRCDCLSPDFLDSEGKCIMCSCGDGHSCESTNGSIRCLCKDNFIEHNGACIECNCKENQLCNVTNGEVTCTCKEGYTEHVGICKECFCGEGHACEIVNEEKVCTCKENYADLNGICKECSCGEHSTCRYEKDEKVCICGDGYVFKDGQCSRAIFLITVSPVVLFWMIFTAVCIL